VADPAGQSAVVVGRGAAGIQRRSVAVCGEFRCCIHQSVRCDTASAAVGSAEPCQGNFSVPLRTQERPAGWGRGVKGNGIAERSGARVAGAVFQPQINGLGAIATGGVKRPGLGRRQGFPGSQAKRAVHIADAHLDRRAAVAGGNGQADCCAVRRACATVDGNCAAWRGNVTVFIGAHVNGGCAVTVPVKNPRSPCQIGRGKRIGRGVGPLVDTGGAGLEHEIICSRIHKTGILVYVVATGQCTPIGILDIAVGGDDIPPGLEHDLIGCCAGVGLVAPDDGVDHRHLRLSEVECRSLGVPQGVGEPIADNGGILDHGVGTIYPYPAAGVGSLVVMDQAVGNQYLADKKTIDRYASPNAAHTSVLDSAVAGDHRM